MPRMFRSIAAAVLLTILACSFTPGALGADAPSVPDALRPWIDWVLDDGDQRDCPLGSAGDGTRVCAWPGRLRLDIDEQGGRFEQRWTLQADAWIPLPGGGSQWPRQVNVAKRAEGVVERRPLAVVERDGRPAAYLERGEHLLSGRFVWPRRPELLAVPSEIGLLSLRLNAVEQARPRLDADGLWLGAGDQRPRTAEPDTLALEVARRIDDDVPLRVRTRLSLDVSGQSREVLLGPVPLDGGIPLRIDSPLPARLSDPTAESASGADADQQRTGMLQVQVRPGRWELTLDSYHPDPVDALSLTGHPAPWPEQEVWVFASRPDLRQVEILGADLVDPRQTRLPADWRSLPAYLMRPGETLRLEQLRRGAAAADRVRLERELRLDFTGDAFSVRDHLQGRLEQRWRLDAEPVLALGQVRVDGQPRFITRLAGEGAVEGVEVRNGRLDLVADARIDSGPVAFGVDLPGSGWALPLDSVSTRLHLPPGWDLLAVDGVDNLPDSWLARWSLLDIFLVLIAALAIAKLWGWQWGLLGLLTLALIWQEPGAPRWVWLHVLAATALLRVLPVGSVPEREASAASTTAPTPKTSATASPGGRGPRWLRGLLTLYYRGALLVLVLIALPFLITQMRDGLFPQLDRHGAGIFGMAGFGAASTTADSEPLDGGLVDMNAEVELERGGGRGDYRRGKQTAGSSAFGLSPGLSSGPRPLPTIDPDARLQTGAGVPEWNWRSYQLSWSGPVSPDHRLRLWLVPPAAALAIAIAQLLLVSALGLRLGRLSPMPKARPNGGLAGLGGLMLVGPMLAGVLLIEPGVALARTATPAEQARAAQVTAGSSPATVSPTVSVASFPPPELLDTLKQRLLEPPECLPRCAEIPRLVLDASATELRLLLAVDAAVAVALPVPGAKDGWSPTVVELDGEPHDGLRRLANGGLVAPVPAGRHLLLLAGPLPRADQVDLPLPLQPRLVEATLDPAWQLEGVAADGRPGDQLRLLRQRAAASGEAAADVDSPLDQGGLPPLLRVIRTLRFGLDWSVATEVQRLSPAAAPVTLRVPLIPGEAVTSAGRQVAGGRILVSLPPGSERTGWTSNLTPVERLTLTAAADPRLSEEWRLEVSPLWHLTVDGVPPVQNLGAAEQWLPTWRPWPGESLRLALSRPIGVPGPTLTLDRSRYQVTPGRRASEARLELNLRSSQGGRHRVQLPAGAELTALTVDGRQRPLALQDGALELPLTPGSQRVVIGWREPTPLRTLFRPAAVQLGTPGVNAETEIQLGRARWVLWTAGPDSGSAIGPAVQFWGLLAVLVVFAAVLARSRLTPLGFVDWFLLGIGLSQVGVWVGGLVAIWLFALGLRRRLDADIAPWRFNLTQLGLVVLSIAALLALLTALQQGLLGSPEMQIAGNGSSATRLSWYLDRQGPETATVAVVSAPIWIYRALMLAWALWLAWRLLGWLRWGWRGLAEPVLWRESRRRREPPLSLDV